MLRVASCFHCIRFHYFPARDIQHKRYECCSTGKFIICLSEEIHTCDTVVIYRHSKVEVIRSGHFTPGHSRTTSCSSAFPLSGVLVDKRANTYGFASGTTTADLVWISRSTGWRRQVQENVSIDILPWLAGRYNHIHSAKETTCINKNYTAFSRPIVSWEANLFTCSFLTIYPLIIQHISVRDNIIQQILLPTSLTNFFL